MAGEKVAYEAKQHWIIYTWPIILGIVSLTAFLLPLEAWINACICCALLLIAFCWGVSIYGGRQYVVTTDRLIFKRGIIKRTSHELLLRKCEGISIEQSLMGRLFGYGSVLVSTGEEKNRYDYIKNPLAFSTCINQQIDNVKDDK